MPLRRAPPDPTPVAEEHEMSEPTKLGIVDATNSDDPFDLSRLRLSQDFLEAAPVKKLLTTVPVRKPGKQDFVRVHPSPAYRALVAVLELKEDNEIYVVDATILPDIQGECFYVTLFTAVTSRGTLFIWPVRVPATNGKACEWHTSAVMAAEHAMNRGWVRVTPNRDLGAYEISNPERKIPEPEWTTLSFQEIIKIAFRDRLINHLDHPVLKRLRGANHAAGSLAVPPSRGRRFRV
jgi:hypothetical protein